MNKKLLLPVILTTILSISSVFGVYAVSEDSLAPQKEEVILSIQDASFEDEIPTGILPGEVPA